MNPNVTAITLLIISVALFFSVADVNTKKVNSLKDKAAEYDKAMQQSNMLIKKRDDLLEQYKSIDSDSIIKLKKMVPDSIDNVRLILEMMKIAGDFNVEIKNIQINAASIEKSISDNEKRGSNIEPSQRYNSAIVTFSIATSYENFQVFIKGLQTNLRLMDVMNIAFSPTTTDKYQFSVTLKTYWMAE